MTEKEYKRIIERLNEINDEQATVIRHLNRRVIELEKMQNVKRWVPISAKKEGSNV